jgi:hypothetical protein
VCIGACLDARSPGAHALGVTRSNVGAQIGRNAARGLVSRRDDCSDMGTRGPNSQTFLKDSRTSWLSGSRRLCDSGL